MAENLPLDDLFGPAESAPPAAAPPAAAPPDALSTRIDGLAQVVSLLVQQQRDAQAFTQGQRAQQQQAAAAAGEAGQGWQPRAYFTKADSLALLSSQAPEETLNNVFNQVGYSVYEPLKRELAYAHRDNWQLRNDISAVYEQDARMKRAQENESRFYTSHADIQEYAFLVPIEAQQIAQESQSNPAAFVGKSEADVHALLADRVRARVKTLRGSEGAVPTSSPAGAGRGGGASRTFMERSSGVRPLSSPAPKDTNMAALAAMHKHMTGAR